MAFLEEGGAVFCGAEDAPAEAVGEADRGAFGALVVGQGGELVEGGDAYLWAEHLALGFGGHDTAAEEALEELAHVEDVGVHGACGAGVATAGVAEVDAAVVVAVGCVGGEGVAPGEGCAGHTEGIEDAFCHELLEGLVHHGLDDELEEIDALAGVAVAGSGLPVDAHFAVGLHGGVVGESGGVGEELAGGDAAPADVSGEVFVAVELGEGLAEVLPDGFVEVEHAGVDNGHDVGGEDAFSEGGGPHFGVGGHGLFQGYVAESEGVGPDDFSVVQDGDLGSGDLGVGEDFAGDGGGFGAGKRRAVEAADVRLILRGCCAGGERDEKPVENDTTQVRDLHEV